jgi:iron(III) transport system substrate-binding protein
LVGPNARDRAVWRGRDYYFADPATRHNLIFGGFVQAGFFYNPGLVSPAEFKSWRDLLDPRWSGKIAVRDPRIPGALQGHVVWWRDHPQLGERFILDLLVGQRPAISGDDRQVIDWVARGQYPIALGPSNTQGTEAMARGLPVQMSDGRLMAEGTYFTAGNASLVIPRNGPHRNATRVYLDWLLSREAQYDVSKASGYPSLRRDVPTDHLLNFLIPEEGVQYHDANTEAYVTKSDEATAWLRTVLP